jgi:dihydropyrimidine dehydrogenase (NAD+) subunit PreT
MEATLQKATEVRGPEALAEQFPPLTRHEAVVEANRCLFCYDAPCTHACPTHIDVPRFIKKIVTDNLIGSAKTILEANLLGATCSRVCPVQELCEGACVLGAERKPIMIGRLQRYVMDDVYSRRMDVFHPASATGKKVAVIGAGPAGLSCAGELRKLGHPVTVFEKRDLPGGLSTYGIIVLREPIDVALAEAEMIERLGVQFKTGLELNHLTIRELQSDFDAVFLATGLGSSPEMRIPGEEHILDGFAYIEASKLNSSRLGAAHNVVVIGAGNTAIDCATIAKRIGAARVTIVYRRSPSEMTAYDHEYEFIRLEGVEFRFFTQPWRVLVTDGKVAGLECIAVRLGAPDASGRPSPQPVPGSNFILPADQVIKAIGQKKPALAELLGLETEKGFIKVNEAFESNVSNIYAGGDCIRRQGFASTVMAVQDGKLAAQSIHRKLMNAPENGRGGERG